MYNYCIYLCENVRETTVRGKNIREGEYLMGYDRGYMMRWGYDRRRAMKGNERGRKDRGGAVVK